MKESRCDSLVFDNVNASDKLRLSVTLPFRWVQEAGVFTKIYVLPVVSLIRNWWDVGAVYMGLASSKRLQMKDGSTFMLNKENTNKLVSVMRGMQISEEARKAFKISVDKDLAYMTVHGKRLKISAESLPSFASEFGNEPHKGVNVKNRLVVDVGAYLGETAVYYALVGGARHVYAFEPFPYLCEKAEENVEMNGLRGKVTMLNAAIAGKKGFMMMSAGESSFKSVGTSFGVKSGGTRRIAVMSLDDVVRKFKINDGIIKIDVEGAEYDMILKATRNALRAFRVIHIEYHYGYLNLVERLRAEGFNVTYTAPIYNYKGVSSKPMLNGDVMAIRKGS
jgi:FkbM family methyltransferase